MSWSAVSEHDVGYAYSMLRDFGWRGCSQDAFVRAFMDIGSLRQPKRSQDGAADQRSVLPGKDPAKSAGTVPADLAELPSRHAGTGGYGQQRETQKAVVQAIGGLPAGERAATSLFYISGNLSRTD